MTLILTNDDGIDAPGLVALRRSLALLAPAEPVWVVAPDREYSRCGHQVTVDRPLAITQRGAGHHTDEEIAVDGTPADCARLALCELAPQAPWLLSGINAGGNLGADIYISGTVAAAREAVLLGAQAIALSQYLRRPLPLDWEQSARWAARAIAAIWDKDPQPGQVWNVNLPHLAADEAEPEVVFCTPSADPLPVAYRREAGAYHYAGRYGDRLRTPGGDVAVCFGGAIAIACLQLP